MTVKTVGTSAENTLIMEIARRAGKELGMQPLLVAMDIGACHLNGCPLRLTDLRDADALNFAHDVNGIRAHIDRETGKLNSQFVPRFADTEEDAEREGRTVTADRYMGDLALLWTKRADALGLKGVPAAKDAIAFFAGAASYGAAIGQHEQPSNLGTFCKLISQKGAKAVYDLRDMTSVGRSAAADVMVN